MVTVVRSHLPLQAPSRTVYATVTGSKMRRNTPGKHSNPHFGPAWANTSPIGCSGRARMNRPMPPIKGLYAVTPDVADTAVLVSTVQTVLAAGARVLQYRNKQADQQL